MKLIVGLGNPGKKYERTRHNAGFWLLERFAAQSRHCDAQGCQVPGARRPNRRRRRVAAPAADFMNASGRAVQMIASFFKIAPEEILVLHDELDFAPGVAQAQAGRRHRRPQRLEATSRARIGAHDYWRLRIGVGHPGARDAVAEYVLQQAVGGRSRGNRRRNRARARRLAAHRGRRPAKRDAQIAHRGKTGRRQRRKRRRTRERRKKRARRKSPRSRRQSAGAGVRHARNTRAGGIRGRRPRQPNRRPPQRRKKAA